MRAVKKSNLTNEFQTFMHGFILRVMGIVFILTFMTFFFDNIKNRKSFIKININFLFIDFFKNLSFKKFNRSTFYNFFSIQLKFRN